MIAFTILPWVNFQTGAALANPAPAFETNKDTDDEDFYGGQIFAKWQVTENLTISPKFMYQKIESDGLPFADVDEDETDTIRFFDSNEPGEDEWWIGSVVLNLSPGSRRHYLDHGLLRTRYRRSRRGTYIPGFHIWRCRRHPHHAAGIRTAHNF